MKQTPNINLPILESGDKYLKDTQNEAFSIIDTEIHGLSEAIKALNNAEGSITETKADVEKLKEENIETNDRLDVIDSSLETIATNVEVINNETVPSINASIININNIIGDETKGIIKDLNELKGEETDTTKKLLFELGSISSTTGLNTVKSNRIRTTILEKFETSTTIRLENYEDKWYTILFYTESGVFLSTTGFISYDYTFPSDSFAKIVISYKNDSDISDINGLGDSLTVVLPMDSVNSTLPRPTFNGKFLFKYDTLLTLEKISSHCMVGEELWVFTVNNDDNSTFTKCYRYTIDIENKTFNKVGQFSQNFGHCNTVSYNEITDTLIIGNGSSDYNLPNKMYIFENASSFKTLSSVNVNTYGLIIDCSSFNWGSKLNVVWGDSNNGQGNICYCITNDNKNIKKVLLGQGTNNLGLGVFSTGKTGLQFNGTLKILKEFKQNDGLDVNQGTCFCGGALFIPLGHNRLFYTINRFDVNDNIVVDYVEEYLYTQSGAIDVKSPCGITVLKDYLIFGLRADGIADELFVFER